MLAFIIRILANSLAIYVANYFVQNLSFPVNNWKLLLLAGLLLSIFNAVLKPILKLISTPLIILSLGLFTLVINLLLIWLLTLVMPQLVINGFWAYVWTTLIVSLVNWIIGILIKKDSHPQQQ